jgi:outer membrane receptor protein involved in Fe transport
MQTPPPLPGLAVLISFALGSAIAADAPSPATGAPPEPPSSIVQLSPFEVVGETRGYYGTNAMSGTRLNSKLEDLAASITVVTKEQMQDFGLLDVNDIFNYEANTEGTGNYTDFTFNLSGMPVDNVQMDPQIANRVRGLNTANTTFGNFETSGRTPVDPSNIDAVEINRGPNSSIFGIGSPAGTVNSVPASANLRRDTATVSVRADTRDGWRASLDVNRVLKRDVLAIRGSIVKQHDGFELKPSGFDTDRLNGMVKFQPFKKTTLSASYAYYKAEGNRPNAVPPRDGISGWLSVGQPTYDPITGATKINGAPVAGTSFFTNAGAGMHAYIGQNGLDFIGQGAGSPTAANGTTTPLVQNQNIRLVLVRADPSGVLAAQPLLPDYPVLSDRSIYDWSSINIAAQNRFRDESHTSSVMLEQLFLETSRQKIAAQVGWFRELSDRYTRNLMGGASAAQGFASTVTIDVNERLLDGRPNPYFLRPFINLGAPQTMELPVDRDTYRGQLAYSLDLRSEPNLLRWLGMHQVLGYAEYKDIRARRIGYRDAVSSDHAWTDRTTIRGSSGPYQFAHRFYLGDNQGNNVDYAPTAINPGASTLLWGDAIAGRFTTEPVTWDTLVATESASTGSTNNNHTILKSQGIVLQSNLLKDRLVTTFGLRHDQRYSRTGREVIVNNGTELDYDSWLGWSPDDWAVGKGPTTTAGGVLKPLRWLNVFLNRSSSFNPAPFAVSLYRDVLPDPTGRGEDYGLSLNLFNNKLVVRVARYKTVQVNSRNGDSASIAQRGLRIDFQNTTGSAFNLQRQAIAWISETAAARGETLTSDQLNERVADVMKLPASFVAGDAPRATARDDVTAEGTELEIYFNPKPGVTLKFNATERSTINAGLAAEVSQWIAERVAVWQTIIDPRVNRPWFTEPYGGATAEGYYTSNVRSPLKIAQALQGKRRPQDPRYAANLLGSYALGNLTDHRILKRFTLGGAVRWTDRKAIGYWGEVALPEIIEDADPSRPIFSDSEFNVDAFATYRTRILADKVGLTLQLNVRNLQESKSRLQPIRAEVDGKYSAYRIIDPRMFILTATFSL